MILRLATEPVTRNAEKARIMPWPRQERSIAGIDAKLRAVIRKCVAGESKWPLVICGSPGTGKSCAALCLADHCRGSEYFALPFLCRLLIRAQQAGLDWCNEGRGGVWREHDIWRMIDEAPLVVLDEIGCRDRVSDAHYEVIKEVIDGRAFKPFVAVSNLSLAELGQVYDGRIVSRLGAGTIQEMTGPDRRLA